MYGFVKRKKVDMIRFTSNSVFKLIPLTATISLIPKFSFRNFHLNFFNTVIIRLLLQKFYDKYGTYLENTSGRYGETEYAIRIFKSNAKIGITNTRFASTIKVVFGSN
jgi:hypothetical protein